MDHTTLDTDTDALLAEVDALLAEVDATDARVDALLAQPVVVTSITGRLAALRQQSAENTAALDAIEAEQSVIAAQLDELERNA